MHDLEQAVSGPFDVIDSSHGVIGWLPVLDVIARQVAGLLADGGLFYLADIHPFPLLFDRHGSDGMELRLKYPYFPSGEPLELPVAGSYADRTATISISKQFRWPHSLGELVSAVASAPVGIEFLHEFPFMVYQGLSFLERREDGLWWIPDSLGIEMPLSFQLKAIKGRRSAVSRPG